MGKKIIGFMGIWMCCMAMHAQSKMSRADALFHSYAYKQAIAEYQKEMAAGTLTDAQYLNLADSYLKEKQFEKAAQYYTDVFKRDTTMSDTHFNKMLQSLAQTDGRDRVKAFLATRSKFLSPELMENARFNFELMDGTEAPAELVITNSADNSAQSDFSPSFYGDDRVLFTSGRPREDGDKKRYAPSNESYLDIYASRLNASGQLYGAKPLGLLPHSYYHKATPFYSPELQTVFYVLSNAQGEDMLFGDKGKNALSIAMVGENGNFRTLLRDLNTSFYYPFYEAASGKLYFAADFGDSGYGGTDIYYVYTNNGQIMSAPVNMGPRVNSPGNEIAPYIFDGSLYFSSDIFYGHGGMDLYKSNFLSDGSLSIPVNLGKGYNTSEDDYGLIIKENPSGGYMGYFASNRKGGKGGDDIYAFTNAQLPGLKTTVVKGLVQNIQSGAAVAQADIQVLDGNGKLIKEVYSGEDGSYRIEIPYEEHINLKVSKERFSTVENDLLGDALAEAQQGSFTIGMAYLDDMLQMREDQRVIDVRKFYFPKGQATVSPEVAQEVAKVAQVLQLFPQMKIQIATYTDSRGTDAANLKLSQDRSDALKKYLINKGVPETSIAMSVGYGEGKIINNCTNGVFCLDVLHRQNERTLFVVLNYQELLQNTSNQQ